MQIARLTESANGVERVAGPAEADVVRIIDDSRQVQAGTLFVARRGGESDGRRYIDDAVRRGAVAVLSDHAVKVPEHVIALKAADPLAAGTAMAQHLHGEPAKKLPLIGITGTNGKTTTAFLVRHLLAAAGRRCGLLGTIEVDTGQQRRPAALTTPGRLEMIELLGEMVAGGCEAAVMEVSSHALHQGRVDDLTFRAGVFTNLSGDHLDYHQTMQAYAAAKAQLMTMLPADGTAIVNADDPAHRMMLENCRANVLRFHTASEGGTPSSKTHDGTVPPASPVNTCTATPLRAGPDGTVARFTGPWGELEARIPLIGRHNVANVAAALAVVHAMGLDVRRLGEAIAACPQVPGRLERVAVDAAASENDASPGSMPEVVVDYAHTDDALTNVLQALQRSTNGKLRVMFGCGGDRDAAKRPRMARTACELADAIVITSDNPRTEDPQQIIDGILTGVPAADRGRVEVELDRRAAIERIITAAEPGDVVLLAGKGHEDYQIVGTRRLTFDDREVARQVLAARAGRRPTASANESPAADRAGDRT